MKSKSVRLLIVLAMVFSMATSLFAGANAETQATGTKKKVELELWTFIELHQKFYEEMAKEFNAQSNEYEISIKVSNIPMNQMHDQLLLSLLSGSGAPDMVDVMIKWAGLFFKSNPEYFANLNDIVEDKKQFFNESILLQFSDSNKNILGIPFHLGAGVMFYNKPAFDAAGIDIDKIEYWDQWVEAGKKLHQPDKNIWFTAVQYAFAREYLLFTMQKGGYMVNPEGKITIDEKPSVDALKFMYDMLHTYKIAEIAPNGSVYDQAFFEKMNKGEVLSLPHAYWYTSRFKSFMPDLAGKIAVRPLPKWRDSNIETASMGGTGTAVVSTSKNVDAAKQFLEFCKLSYEGNVKIATFLGFDPLRSDVYNDPRLMVPDPFFMNEPILNVVKQSMDNFVGKPVWPVSTDLQTEISRDLLPAVLGGQVSPEKGLSDLANKFRQKK